VAALIVFPRSSLSFSVADVFSSRASLTMHDLQTTWPVLLGNARQTISDTFDQLGVGDLDETLIGPNLDDLARQAPGDGGPQRAAVRRRRGPLHSSSS
jgi:hypothetical protein